MKPFITHVLQKCPKFANVVASADNIHGFDNLFAPCELLEHHQLVPDLITRANKNMLQTINNIIFKDTFLSMGNRVKDQPKRLGLS